MSLIYQPMLEKSGVSKEPRTFGHPVVTGMGNRCRIRGVFNKWATARLHVLFGLLLLLLLGMKIIFWGTSWQDRHWNIVTELISEVRYDLWGHLEAAMTSEVTKIADIVNMRIHVRVIEVIELNSEVRSGPWGYNHCCPLVCRVIVLLLKLTKRLSRNNSNLKIK